MSLLRGVYLTSVASGWGAYLGWLVCEPSFRRGNGTSSILGVLLVGAAIGGFIGGGAGSTTAFFQGVSPAALRRACFSILGGLLGGAIGAFLGSLLYSLGLPRALGWLILGASIGCSDGLFQRAPIRIRNGALGGAVGGLIGGLIFDPVQVWFHSDTGMSSRAAAFVILGISIGALLGLSHLVFKRAWLTVLDGYRPGRQLVLDKACISLGSDDVADLSFRGKTNDKLERIHARISRTASGEFVLSDNATKLGTLLNGVPLRSETALKDGDTIRIGSNFVRFNSKNAKAPVQSAALQQPTSPAINAPPPPPPLRQAKPAIEAPSLRPTTGGEGETPASVRVAPPTRSVKPSSFRTAPLASPPPPPPPPKRPKP